MREECINRLTVFTEEAADKADKLESGSEERERESRSMANLAKEINSQCKIEYERIQNDYEIRIKELRLKEMELADAKKKNIAELIVKGGLGLVGGLFVPIFIAIAEPKGLFVRPTNWKMPKI